MDITLSDFERYIDEDGVERGRRRKVPAQYAWVGAQLLQGGTKGLVLSRDGNHYRTAFVEAFIDDTFIRGEGTTVEEAETSAWNKYKKYIDCSGHEYEARGYVNGGGFCKHCNRFKSEAFTAEELGQYCLTCGTATMWSSRKDDSGERVFGCEEHPEQAEWEKKLLADIRGEKD